MTTSYNGWTAGTREAAGVVIKTVPGTSVALPLNKDCADLLVWVAEQFHETVEPLNPGWCWGWADRLVRGSTRVSNHASGTAMDLNAPKHPLGKRGTFTAVQERRIRAIVAKAAVVTWGGDYRARADEMHFEISDGATRAQVRAAYAKVSLPVVSLAHMKHAFERDRHRRTGLHPIQTRRVQRALGFTLRTGRWGKRTRARFPAGGPTRATLAAVGKGRFRVVD